MKKLVVEIADGTNAELVEKVEIKHMSDLGGEVKDAIEDFVKLNEGIVMPPVMISVTEKGAPTEADCGAAAKSR
ncbi:MAG: hypothetical protein ABJF10_16920 [Chthoniobacter sp.]|uniref:hypothetical protein n=1 Tax=Chthoniobacter sp. TaxID=2510640 RepID=UPI0032A9E50C